MNLMSTKIAAFTINDFSIHRGFAFKTVGFRLPVILTKIIDHMSREKNNIVHELGKVRFLISHMPQCKAKITTYKLKPIASNESFAEFLLRISGLPRRNKNCSRRSSKTKE